MKKIDTIYNEDCLVGMKDIADKSIDLVICDLPYGQTHNEWDSTIPMEPLWKEYKRVCKEDTPIILFGQGMFTANLMISNREMWRYNLIWKKGGRTSGFLNAKRQPLRNHEDILVFYKKQPVYHPQMRLGQPLHGRGSGTHRFVNNNYGKYVESKDDRAGTTEKYPISILDFDRPHPPIHPTQKPIDLIAYLIRTYSDEGDTVLDNCMGVGTTALAAVKENRHFIGFETNIEYYTTANKRLNGQ